MVITFEMLLLQIFVKKTKMINLADISVNNMKYIKILWPDIDLALNIEYHPDMYLSIKPDSNLNQNQTKLS